MVPRFLPWIAALLVLLAGCTAGPDPGGRSAEDDGPSSTPSTAPSSGLQSTTHAANWSMQLPGGAWAAATRVHLPESTECTIMWMFHSLNDPHGVDVAYGILVGGEPFLFVLERSWTTARFQGGPVDTGSEIRGLPGGIVGQARVTGTFHGELLLVVAVHEAESSPEHPESLGWSIECDKPLTEPAPYLTQDVTLFDDRSANGTASGYVDLGARASLDAVVRFTSQAEALVVISVEDYEAGNLSVRGPGLDETLDLANSRIYVATGVSGNYEVRWRGATIDADSAVDNDSGGIAGLLLALEPM